MSLMPLLLLSVGKITNPLVEWPHQTLQNKQNIYFEFVLPIKLRTGFCMVLKRPFRYLSGSFHFEIHSIMWCQHYEYIFAVWNLSHLSSEPCLGMSPDPWDVAARNLKAEGNMAQIGTFLWKQTCGSGKVKLFCGGKFPQRCFSAGGGQSFLHTFHKSWANDT